MSTEFEGFDPLDNPFVQISPQVWVRAGTRIQNENCCPCGYDIYVVYEQDGVPLLRCVKCESIYRLQSFNGARFGELA